MSSGTPVPTEKSKTDVVSYMPGQLYIYTPPERKESSVEFEDREGYDALLKVLKEAYDQASIGKGRERHAHGGKPFTDQQILTGQRKYGMGFALGQADKKMEEAFHMPKWSSARRDLLGALVYVSAAILFGDEVNQKEPEDLIEDLFEFEEVSPVSLGEK